MRTKGLIFLLLLVSMIHAPAADHVTELWRDRLGPSGENDYFLANAILDSSDNLILGGSTRYLGFEGFIAKYDSTGSKLWEYRDSQLNGVEKVDVDGEGNIYFTARASTSDNFHLAFTKISPEGIKLWSKVMDCMVAYSTIANHSLYVQADGTSFFLSWFLREKGPDEYDHIMTVTKFSDAGDCLWKTELPGPHLVGGPDSMDKLMNVSTSGEVFVTGISLEENTRNAFVLKLNFDGSLAWRTTFSCSSVTSILPGANYICVATDSGWALLSSDGVLVKIVSDHTQVLHVLDVCDDDHFLLSYSFGYRYLLLGPDGTMEWTSDTFAYRTSNIIRDETGGWLMVAYINHNGASDEYSLIDLRHDGNQRWRQSLVPFPAPNFLAQYGYLGGEHWVLKASDGTLRVVCRLGPSSERGIGMVSYRLESSDDGPSIINTPPAFVDWNGAEDLTLSYTVSGTGPLAFTGIAGAPQSMSTIVLNKQNFPDSRGFYRWDVTDADGRSAATRNTLVRVNQLSLHPDLMYGKIDVIADYFSRFRVEYSTNLVDWLPLNNDVYSASTSIEPPANLKGGYFYRAVKVP